MAQFEEAGGVLGNAVEASSLDLTFPIHDSVADYAVRHGNPFSILGAVLATDVVPATQATTLRGGQIGQIDQFVRILLRVVEPAHDDVRSAAHAGGNRCFWAQVFPAFAVGAYCHTGFFSEFLDVGIPQILVALDEALPAQHA